MRWDSLGQHIRTCRQDNRMRQEDLAEKVGVSANYIGMVERGEKMPSLETFVRLANALGVSADWLLADLLEQGYTGKASRLAEQIAALSAHDRDTIYDVVDTLLRHAAPPHP